LWKTVFETRDFGAGLVLIRGIVKTFNPNIFGMPDQQQQRRAPAKPKNIEDIDSQRDIRARVVGTVISVEEESVTVDDGTGSVEIFMQEDDIENIEENDKIRVLGRVLPTPDSFEIQAEIVHSLEDVDMETYNRVKKIVNTSE
jgi:hypothetical protein